MTEIFSSDLNVTCLTAIVNENTYVNTFPISVVYQNTAQGILFFFYEEIDDFYKIQSRINFQSMAH